VDRRFENKAEKETQIYIETDIRWIDKGKNESKATSVLLGLRSALKAGWAITKYMGYNSTPGHSGTWEGDSQIFRFPDVQSLQVACIKPKEMFQITIRNIQRPLELSIDIFEAKGQENYFKLPPDSRLPSGKKLRTVIKKRMVDGEPMWTVEVLIDMVK
jgi:hypothetical protein